MAFMIRVFLSRESTNCFQEHVFSCAGFVGKKLCIRTLSHMEEKIWLSRVNCNVYAGLQIIKRKRQFKYAYIFKITILSRITH